jgi:hypothetical protein
MRRLLMFSVGIGSFLIGKMTKYKLPSSYAENINFNVLFTSHLLGDFFNLLYLQYYYIIFYSKCNICKS